MQDVNMHDRVCVLMPGRYCGIDVLSTCLGTCIEKLSRNFKECAYGLINSNNAETIPSVTRPKALDRKEYLMINEG